jgi:hypothetical protein
MGCILLTIPSISSPDEHLEWHKYIGAGYLYIATCFTQDGFKEDLWAFDDIKTMQDLPPLLNNPRNKSHAPLPNVTIHHWTYL